MFEIDCEFIPGQVAEVGPRRRAWWSFDDSLPLCKHPLRAAGDVALRRLCSAISSRGFSMPQWVKTIVSRSLVSCIQSFPSSGSISMASASAALNPAAAPTAERARLITPDIPRWRARLLFVRPVRYAHQFRWRVIDVDVAEMGALVFDRSCRSLGIVGGNMAQADGLK